MSETKKAKEEILCCGLIMPISAIDGCDEAHWVDVKDILTDTVDSAGLRANLVSYADEAGIIQKRIIQNLYENPIVICDVSGKNPNVMFELGMRLAFDKPTIIIKDDETSYSFDTSPIEHVTYPRDLRFTKIIEFKKVLRSKILSTLEKSSSDSDYTSFLKHFGTFKVAHIDTKEVSKEEFIIEELKEIRRTVSRLSRPYEYGSPYQPTSARIMSNSVKAILYELITEAYEIEIANGMNQKATLKDLRNQLLSSVANSRKFEELPGDKKGKLQLLENAFSEYLIDADFFSK